MPLPPGSHPDVHRLQREVDSLRQAVEELSVLNDIAREIGALADLEEVLQRIVSKAVAAVGAEEGVISLVDSEESESAHTLIRSMMTGIQRGPYHLNEHVIGWMQLYCRPLRVECVSEDERLRAATIDPSVQSLLSVPLQVRSRLIGVLTVYHKECGCFTDSHQRLLSIIAAQSAQIIENARLYEEEKALLRLQDELRSAFQIQSRLLPAHAPAIDGYDLAARSIPAQQVGGDFFDFIVDGSGRTIMCVGDVSGKGLPAALLMASAQATVRGQAGVARPPAETVEHINQEVYRNVRRGKFVTLVYGELEPGENCFRYVNAGHNRPLLLRRSGEVSDFERTGLAIGLVPEASYQQGEIQMDPGDLLFIYSDGVTEAMNSSREEFGVVRLIQALKAASAYPASGLLDRVVRELAAFTGEAPVSDDITMLALVRRS